jgi:hypothetical protein
LHVEVDRSRSKPCGFEAANDAGFPKTLRIGTLAALFDRERSPLDEAAMRNRILIASSLVLFGALAQACSGSDSSSSRPGFGNHAVTGDSDGGQQQTGVGPGDGGTTPIDPDAEAPPNSGVCNYQDNTGTTVNVTNNGASMPVGAGGVQPLDGEYNLTTVTHYGGGSTNDTYKATVYLSAGTHQYAVSKNGAADVHTTVSVEYQPDGSLTWTGKCGDMTTATLSYAAPTETTLIVYDPNAQLAYTYVRPIPPDGM